MRDRWPDTLPLLFFHQINNPLPFYAKTNQGAMKTSTLEQQYQHSYLLEKMIWLRGCSDHPFLYQKELSSAQVEAGQLLGNWGQRETPEHPLWSTRNKKVKSYICAVAHRNGAVMTGQTSTQYTNKKQLESVWEKEGFRNLHYVKRMVKEFQQLKQRSHFRIFNMYCYCSTNRNLMGPTEFPARYKYAICKEQLKIILDGVLEIFVLFIFLLSWNIMNWSI